MTEVTLETSNSSVNRIVSAAPAVGPTNNRLPGKIPIVRLQKWAPAWFYSALNWLGTSYFDATGNAQTFTNVLYGSDVDPYTQLGATRLFYIERIDDLYVLSVAPDLLSSAPLHDATETRYQKSDAGILAMYNALAASAVFSAIKYCYIPAAFAQPPFGAANSGLSSGYDPATGIRVIVEGSALVQVVPLADFNATQNEQIYDPDPQIVPIVPAFVYDVTQDNALGATTFALPVYYARDVIGGTSYVNRIATTTTLNAATVGCGQTAVFPGGPGYDDTHATLLALASTEIVSVGGRNLTTYTFDKAKVTSFIPIQPRVETGVCVLTYSGTSPSAIFANQTITGFYQDPSWTTCPGLPIYDYGPANSSFTSANAAMATPQLIYGTSNQFLNGGPLQTVLQKLAQATYLKSTDSLVAVLDGAIAAKNTADGVGLSVTSAALDFTMHSSAASTVVNALSVPVLATVTTTPPRAVVPDQHADAREAASATAAPSPVISTVARLGALQSVGAGATAPSQTQSSPKTIQISLIATIPQAALAATDIGNLEIGTVFPQQTIGAGATFAANSAGAIFNLMASPTPALAPFTLSLTTVGVTLTAGVTYTFSLAGNALSITGAGVSAAQTELPSGTNADTAHTFVGMATYTDGMTSVPLYPLLMLAFAAPAVGTYGVTQGTPYAIQLTIGTTNSTYDIIDSTQTVVSAGVSVETPTPADNAQPQPGALYFGSFTGGAATVDVWSVPVFLAITPAQVAIAGFGGTMTLGAQVSGLPAYDLTITDSSLFVYSNINIDNGNVGSVSSNNVYLASAVINAAPDDHSTQAFAPSRLLMGIIRQVQNGNELVYAFIPEDDSVVIGDKRYMLSVVNLGTLGIDPNALPYPPSYWPQCRYWQFANRHNPYLAVEYEGKSEAERVAKASADSQTIGAATLAAEEPMQLYLDTNAQHMTVWPIFAFPFATSTQSVDTGQFKTITSTILGLLGTIFPTSVVPTAAQLGEQIVLPSAMAQNNPFTAGVTGSVNTAGGSPIVLDVANAPAVSGQTVTNLSPNSVASSNATASAMGAALPQSRLPLRGVVQERAEYANSALAPVVQRLQVIFGFSIWDPASGEAYVVEVVGTDLRPPDQLPDASQDTTYDPYYVRVVFLNRLTSYNMSIIVPSMARDQYGYLAHPGTIYENVLSKTDDLRLGYQYTLADANQGFDLVSFIPDSSDVPSAGASYLYTNLPYTLVGERDRRESTAAFLCRRRNWDADCHLMLASVADGTHAYRAFGGGDLAPLRLDAGVTLDQRQPAHLVEFTYQASDKLYDSAQTFSTGNVPYFVGVTTLGGTVQYTNFSINAAAGTTGVQAGTPMALQFPPSICIVGEASTTLTNVANVPMSGADATDTSAFANQDQNGNVVAQQFQIIPYNNLVYVVRAVSNCFALGYVGGGVADAGLLIDTFVPTPAGYLALARGARYKQSGLQYFGSTYTMPTMVDTLDQLDFTSVTGETFYAPTIFVPIPELDSNKGFVANLSDFLGQQIWTFVYPEIVVQPGNTLNGVICPDGYNLDPDGKPVLSLQKLQYIYDPLAVLFTPNDLTHKYPLQPKQQVLALTNGQIREAICWRTANVQPDRHPPQNVCAQESPPDGIGMDRTNIIYASRNWPVDTALGSGYKGMSVNGFVSVSGVLYNIEESAMTNDRTGTNFISQVSSVSNMLIGVLFDYDNNELGTLSTYDEKLSTKGVVFLNGYLGASGYSFSSPDHFDVNDVLPCQVPLLDEIADILGFDVAFYDIDANLPQQFWSFSYDAFTAAGLPNYIADVPPAPADPTFTNRTRSLVLNLQNPLRPTQLGLMDTYSSVVSANLHLQNGITGAIFLNKKADRDIASIGSNPNMGPVAPLYGLQTGKYDFFIFSRDHYATLQGCSFDLIDMGYAMCVMDDGTGTGTKNARYFVDSDGNYNELYAYVLYSKTGGVLETSTFTLKVTLASPANLSATPPVAETPNSVNPTDLVAQINKVSNLIYAAFGPSSPGQPAALIPIQAVGGNVQATPIMGAPGFNGYLLNVAGTSGQPVQISQIFSGSVAWPIAGSTTIVPQKSGKAVPFYGSLSHGLDKLVPVNNTLQSTDHTQFIPRSTTPTGVKSAMLGGNGLGSVSGMPFSCAFQGSGAIPPAVASDPTPGTTMKGDDTVFYTYNGVTNGVADSNGKTGSASGCLYFIDATDPANPVYGMIATPKFTLNGYTYAVNISSTLADGVTSCYTLVAGNRSYAFSSATQVTVDSTVFTFNALPNGIYTVTYTALDAPAVNEAPTPITLTPFSMTAGGLTTIVDVFTNPGGLQTIALGVTGRVYAYDPVKAIVTVSTGTSSTAARVNTGFGIVSATFYAYVIGFANNGFGSGVYTVNGASMCLYPASTTGAPASYPIMTSPQMFTLGGNFYTFDQDASGNYLSVTGNGQTIPVDPYQFSLNGTVYIINTNVQPYAVVGGATTYPMTAANTQFELNGVQYTITPKGGSLSGATISGQFDTAQANVVVLQNYVYELDIPNGRIVGNGTAYPLSSSGFTYSISTVNQSYTVTTEANATTVTIGNVVYQINDTTVVGDGITYPILPYRTFTDGAQTWQIGFDGTANLPQPFTLSASTPPTFTDGPATYTVDANAVFDGTNYYPLTGTPPQFEANGSTYQVRNDAAVIAAGPVRTYIAPSGPLQPNQFTFGTVTIHSGRPTDVAAFDGTQYYAIANNAFTDSMTGKTYTLSGNTAVHDGNSYLVFSNLGQGAYFEGPDGKTYFVNVAVADLGVAAGTIYQVFPITGGSITMPLQYTITVSGDAVTVAGLTFAGPTAAPTLTAAGNTLTGGYFKDPVTQIVYTCAVNAGVTEFIDSNNAVYPFPAQGTSSEFVASVVISTGGSVALDNHGTLYPVVNNTFIAGTARNTTTYTVNVPVAYQQPASGSYWPVVNQRFVVPQVAPASNIAYTVRGNSVIKGYVISEDDEFSPDSQVVYTVNAVNVVKATNQPTLNGTVLTAGSQTYALNTPAGFVSTLASAATFDTSSRSFTVKYNELQVSYTLAQTTVTDNRRPVNTFQAQVGGSQITFTDSASGVTFTFDDSGNNPVTAQFTYTNNFFIDAITGTTYYIDTSGTKVESISYLPETTEYAFTAANGVSYLIHYSDVDLVFPVISGANVNAGIATVGTDIFTVHVDGVVPTISGADILTNQNSFEINGNLYTIAGTPAGNDYGACSVVGDNMAPQPFLSDNTFSLADSVVYTLHLDDANLPTSITASFPVKPSRNLISVNDDIYLISYYTVSTGSLLGQGQASIPITQSGFRLTNSFDTTVARFTFDDLDIYDAGAVVGQFTVYTTPTFFLGSATYTLNTASMIVTDNNDQPYRLIPNPAMFSINGFNYVIDTNRVPHAIVGNDNVSPLSTDVTVQNGVPVPNTTFTLNGQIYAYVENAQRTLLAITGTKLYPVTASTFKLDSSLIFTVSVPATPTATASYPGSAVPIGTITAGTSGPVTSATTVLNLYAGTNESGGADFFTYKNVLYTLIKSNGVYTAVQKTYTVYVSQPVPAQQQQLAVFDLAGTTCIVTDGTTAGTTPATGLNPGTMWSATSTTSSETQFGLVYGLASPPTSVSQSTTTTPAFQFAPPPASGPATLYNILYQAGGNQNMVQVNVPDLLPTFMQSALFDFYAGVPLTIETGGYNAFNAAMNPMAIPEQTFAGSFRTPLVATDVSIDSLMGQQGDFTLEFWHSLTLVPVSGYHPFTYQASTNDDSLVYDVDVCFDDASTIYVRINNTVMQTVTTKPVFSSRWRHFAISYAQPYAMLCQGAGFEVADGTNYNFSNDFSIAMTFAVADIKGEQTLVYKGTSSDNTTPAVAMSYALGVVDGNVMLTLTDGNGNVSPGIVGPSIVANTYYQVIAVKHSTTPATGVSGSSDPYDPPFSASDVASAGNAGGSGTISALPTSGTGSVSISNIGQNDGPASQLTTFISNVSNPPANQSYSVTISVRTVNDDGTLGAWNVTPTQNVPVADANGLLVLSTGNAHLLIGAGFDREGNAFPLGSLSGAGNIRDLYLFNTAIDSTGLKSQGAPIDLADAGTSDLQNAGIVGYWHAQYDPNGVVNNPYDTTAVALPTNAAQAFLIPLSGWEIEGTSLYIDGYAMNVSLASAGDVNTAMPAYTSGNSLLAFNAGPYRLEEISLWSMARAQYQLHDDMFGRLIPGPVNPSLSVYLSGEFALPSTAAPALPMNKYLDSVEFQNAVTTYPFKFTPATLDLIGSPCVGRCGPLIAPNLYTPPGVALTVCDTVPYLTSYSVTVNTTTPTLAGEINEAYVYVKNGVIMLYAGKKVGDLTLTWVSEEQGDLQIIGYVEGAPPAPMANLTNKASYAGATSITLTAPTSVTLKYQSSHDSTTENKLTFKDTFGIDFGLGMLIAPFGFGAGVKKMCQIDLQAGAGGIWDWSNDNGKQDTESVKLDESNKYTVKMQGTLSPYTADSFMANLNAVTTPSTTPGTPGSKTAILPDPNLGGFTQSNAPAQLPKGTVTDEKFGQRMFVPSPYGQAFVTSQTLDVYQQTLVQSGTTYGFVAIPNAQIPRDLNVVSFRLNSQYIRPGCLDGLIGYAYEPATLPDGASTFTTSTGQMAPLYDGNFSSGVVGHDASYMQLVEAYQVKKQIDQQAYNSLAIYNSVYGKTAGGSPQSVPDPALTPALDFYDEYVWSSRGATQEVRHTYSTTYEEVLNTGNVSSKASTLSFNLKIHSMYITVLNPSLNWQRTTKDTYKYSYTTTATSSFDITASFDGVDADTQMRYSSNNDAHFVMNFNSMFNPGNQSGIDLTIGSDGLVYQIVPSATSGAGLALSNNLDTSQSYAQPQPAYATGNADGLSGNLEAYDRPGKTNLYRTYVFFLQPTAQNADNFWSTVVDPVWLSNSPDLDAVALRNAQSNGSIPWRLFYRVTYSEQFAPPVSAASVAIPQITPIMAVPVLDTAADFLFEPLPSRGARPASNPANDIEANVVLVQPTQSGFSVGANVTSVTGAVSPALANNVIPFDILKNATTIVNWGDSNNGKLLTQLITSISGANLVAMSPSVLPGSTPVTQVADPVNGGTLYSVYTDPNGITVNVPTNFGIAVYQDVNGNPIQYFDGKTYHALQQDYVASPDGTIMYYVQPPSSYDQSTFNLSGDYDPYSKPGDEWRYFLVSGASSNMSEDVSFENEAPFFVSSGFTGFRIATAQHAANGANQVKGYVLAQGMLQYPNLNTSAETFADLSVYKAMSLLDTFPIGDPATLTAFLEAQYPDAPFVGNQEISAVFTRNITSYLNTLQQALTPQ